MGANRAKSMELYEEHVRVNAEKYAARVGVKDKYLCASLEDFDPGDVSVWMSEFLSGKKSVYICGDSRFGKTRLATAILKEYMATWIPESCWDDEGGITRPHYQNYFKACYFPSEIIKLKQSFSIQGASEWGALRPLIEARFLLLDDVGADRHKDFGIEALNVLVNERIERGFTTIYTSNYDIDKLASAYDLRVAERIKEDAALIRVFPEMWREPNPDLINKVAAVSL